MNPLIVIAFVLLAVGLFVLAQLLLPLLYDFDVTPRGVEERVLKWIRVRTIPFADIKAVRVMQRGDWFAIGEPGFMDFAGNRIWRWSRSVLILKKRGLVRVIGLTPREPEEFVARVREGMNATEQLSGEAKHSVEG